MREGSGRRYRCCRRISSGSSNCIRSGLCLRWCIRRCPARMLLTQPTSKSAALSVKLLQSVVPAAEGLETPVDASQQHMIQPMQSAASARAAAPLQEPANCTTIQADAYGSAPRPQLTDEPALKTRERSHPIRESQVDLMPSWRRCVPWPGPSWCPQRQSVHCAGT